MSELSFFAPGIPAPKGSMKPVNVPGLKHTILVPDNDRVYKPWVKSVVQVATLALAASSSWAPKYSGPVNMMCRFFLPMPTARPAWLRRQGIGLCTVKPDLDKLTRAIGDACKTAGLYADDSYIAKDGHVKYEVADHNLCGAEIILRWIDLDEGNEMEMMLAALARRGNAPRVLQFRR